MTSVSTLGTYQRLMLQNSLTQQRISDIQTQIGSGKKGTAYGDFGPADSRTSLDLRPVVDRLEAYQRNIALSKQRTDSMETSLRRVSDIAQRVFDRITVQLGPGNSDVAILQEEARKGLRELVSVLNTEVGGRQLFAGGEVGRAPISLDGIDALITAFESATAADLAVNGGRDLITDYTNISRRLNTADPATPVTLLNRPLTGLYPPSLYAASNSIETASTIADGLRQVISQPTLYNNNTIVDPNARSQVTSTTSVTLPVAGGTVLTFAATDPGPALSVGMNVEINDGATPPTRTLTGEVMSYDGGTVQIRVIGSNGPAGAHASWNISGDAPNQALRADAWQFREMMRGMAIAATIELPQNPTAAQSEGFRNVLQHARDSIMNGKKELDNQIGVLGNTAKQIEAVGKNHDMMGKAYQITLGHAEDVDMADAISKLQLAQVQLQASFRVTAQIRDLTLINFL